MLKISVVIGTLTFVCCSWFSGLTLPRFAHGPLDYLIMPLLGYFSIIVAAQIGARIVFPQDEAKKQKP